MTANPADVEALKVNERVMVFIDGSNFYHALDNVCGRHDVNFERFVAKLTGSRNLRRTYYYTVKQIPESGAITVTEQEKFIRLLQTVPYMEVRMGVSKLRGGEMVEKGVDVMIATDIVVNAFRDNYDTAILVSGDADFFPALQASKDLGRHIEVASFDANSSVESLQVADVDVKLNRSYFQGLWVNASGKQTKQASKGKEPVHKLKDHPTSAEEDKNLVNSSQSDNSKNGSGKSRRKQVTRSTTKTTTSASNDQHDQETKEKNIADADFSVPSSKIKKGDPDLKVSDTRRSATKSAPNDSDSTQTAKSSGKEASLNSSPLGSGKNKKTTKTVSRTRRSVVKSDGSSSSHSTKSSDEEAISTSSPSVSGSGKKVTQAVSRKPKSTTKSDSAVSAPVNATQESLSLTYSETSSDSTGNSATRKPSRRRKQSDDKNKAVPSRSSKASVADSVKKRSKENETPSSNRNGRKLISSRNST